MTESEIRNSLPNLRQDNNWYPLNTSKYLLLQVLTFNIRGMSTPLWEFVCAQGGLQNLNNLCLLKLELTRCYSYSSIKKTTKLQFANFDEQNISNT